MLIEIKIKKYNEKKVLGMQMLQMSNRSGCASYK